MSQYGFDQPDLLYTGRKEGGREVRQLVTIEDRPSGPVLVLQQYQYPASIVRRCFELKEITPPE
jgi:hypothetical protein